MKSLIQQALIASKQSSKIKIKVTHNIQKKMIDVEPHIDLNSLKCKILSKFGYVDSTGLENSTFLHTEMILAQYSITLLLSEGMRMDLVTEQQ